MFELVFSIHCSELIAECVMRGAQMAEATCVT